MSFSDLFRPLKLRDKLSYKVDVVAEKSVKPVLKAPAHSINNAEVTSVNALTNNEWRHHSPVLLELQQRVTRLVNGKRPSHLNVVDFSQQLHQSTHSFFREIIPNEATLLSYKLMGLLDSSHWRSSLELSNAQIDKEVLFNAALGNLSNELQKWSINQQAFTIDVILAWNTLQYFDENQIKKIIQLLSQYTHTDTLLYMVNCPYLSVTNNQSIKFSICQNEVDNKDETRITLKASHHHQEGSSLCDAPMNHSLGNIPRLLQHFELVKVNNMHNPSVSECLAKSAS